MRKLLSLLLVIMVLSSLLAACGSSAGNGTASTQAATTAVKVQETTKAEPVTIKYFDWTKADTVIQTVTDEYMKENPNVKVEADFVPNDQYMTVLKTKVISGDAPDVYGMLVGMDLTEYAKAGYVADLSNESYIKDFGKSALETAMVDGKIYGLPTKINVSGVFYNKKMFTEYGLSVPQSWEEFLAVCEVIKSKGIIPISQGHKTEWASLIIPYEILSQTLYYDNNAIDDALASGTAKFNDTGDGWNNALNKYLELQKKGYFNKDFLSTDYPQAVALFTNRKAAMTIVPTWALPMVNKAENTADFGYFAFKMKKENRPVSFGMVASAISLSATSKNMDAAKNYLAYWAKDENLGLVSGKQAVPTKTTIKTDFDPIIKDYMAQLNVGTDLANIDKAWPLGVQPILIKGYSEMFAAGRKPAEVLADMDKEVARWITEQSN
ncbi:MAG: hypothetical protein A2Y21_09105 [Clostridiales bacterium GWC2_40_7]|nr:MAG: hypothetical protein A2Y21_09105 [Clostridiales bacterium GWC2_40_7]